jgi:hypothetical protein
MVENYPDEKPEGSKNEKPKTISSNREVYSTAFLCLPNQLVATKALSELLQHEPVECAPLAHLLAREEKFPQYNTDCRAASCFQSRCLVISALCG